MNLLKALKLVSSESYTNKNVTAAKTSSFSSLIEPVSSPLLQKGQIIKGEIADIRNQEVTIKTEDGQTITAPLHGSAELTIGGHAIFRVVENESGETALQQVPPSKEVLLDLTISKALDAAGLPKTEKNQEIVKALLENQLSIDKQSIQNLIRQTLLFKDASISTLALLTKHKIPINDANISAFDNINNYEHRISKELLQVSDEIPSLMQEISSAGSMDMLPSLHIRLMDILLQSGTSSSPTDAAISQFLKGIQNGTVQDIQAKNQIASLNIFEKEQLLSILKDFPLTEEAQQQVLDGTLSYKDLFQLIETARQSAVQADEKTISEFMKQGETDLKQYSFEIEKFEHPVISDLTEKFNSIQKNNREIGSILNQNQRNSLLEQLKDLKVPSLLKQMIQDGSIKTDDFLSLLKSFYPEAGKNALQSFFEGKELKLLLKDTILEHLSLSAKDIAKQDGIQEYYSKLEKMLPQLSKLTESIQTEDANAKTSLPNTILANARENIEFMKTLNQFFPYIQLPVRIKDKTLHSELYVYTNKKQNKKDSSNTSILLHLDMDYLGNCDIHLNLNNKQLSAKFCLDTKEAVTLVTNHLDSFTEALEQKGYHIQTEVIRLEKETNHMESFMQKNSPVKEMKRFSFDIRA